MSATIDERVVEMKFNNKDFEQNAKTSISTIERLKQALNFTASANGLDDVQNAVKRVDMKGLGDAVDSVKLKFSALQVAAITALSNIVNKAVNAGQQLARSFTLDPIMQGFNEYQTKLGSIQTILANTQSQTGEASKQAVQEVNTAAEQAAIKSEELNQQAISNLQKRNEAEVKALEKSQKAQLKALEKSQKAQSKALQKSQKQQTKKLQESQEKETEILQEKQEKKREIIAEAQSKELEALNTNYDKQLTALKEQTSKELELLRQAHQSKLDMYNEEYMSKLKAADEDRYNQIKAIDDEINGLKNLTKQEKKASEESAKQEKLNALKALRDKVETEAERKEVEKRISDYEAELALERTQEERENRIEELEAKKKDINEAFSVTKENLQEEYKANVENENNIYSAEVDSINKTQQLKQKAIQESYKKELEALNKRQSEELKALQKKQQNESKALSKKQQEESEKLSERQQNESEALSERQQDARDALNERQQNERDALSERQSAEMQAMSERHQTELANIESEKKARLNEEAAKNTKTTGLKDVTDALDELNTYADKTIYNFADMTRNIGTFTAAGVDLETSVQAIKGIANLAAVSGSNSQQASTAMYQLSQAIATGTVKLMDWNSVVNAGMGGKTFQNSLIETARVHGVAIDDIIAKNGSFRDSLQEGWLTSDILLETLNKFTGDLSEEQLKSMGYTDKQAKDIVKMGNTAVDAATKVRTSTQLIDTTKEAIGSGWAQTFELIFGDFNEATNLWTGLSEAINGGLQKQIDYRNKILTIWKANGGRTILIDAFKNAWEGLASIIKPIQEAFRDIFPKTTGQQLITWTKNLRDFTSKLKLSDTASENLKKTFSGLFSFIDLIRKGFLAAFNILKPGVGVITNLAGAVLDVTGKLGEWVTQINKTVSKDTTLAKGFEGIKNTVASVFTVFNNFVTSIRKFISSNFKMPDVSFISNFSKSIETGTKPLETFLNLIKTGFTEASKVLSKVAPVFKALIKPITDLFKGGMGLEDAVNILGKGTLIAVISKFILDLSGLIKKAKKAFDPLKDIAKEIGNTFGALQNQINSKALMNVAAAIAILVGSLILLSKVPEDKLGSSLASIAALLGELVGVIVVLSKSDTKAVKGISTTMLAMSASVILLATAMKKIADVDPKQMVAAGIAVGALLAELAVITSKMAKSEKKFKAGALSLIAMGASVLLLAEAVKKLSKLKPGELLQGGGAVAAALLLISVLSKASEKGGFKISNGAGILALAASMFVFQKAVSAFGQMDPNQLKQGGIAVGLLIGALTAFEAIAGRVSHGFGSSAGTLLMATALTVLLVPLKVLGKMDFNQLKQGLGAVAVALGEFAVAALLMKNTQKSAISITAMAAALLILTPVLKVLGTMNLPSLGIALAALAGTFGVLGAAAILLKPVAPTLLKLSAAVAILGVGMLGIGAGIAAFAVGLTTLAGAGAAAAAALVLMVKSIVVGVIQALNESLPLLVQTVLDLITNVLAGIAEIIPSAAESIYNIVSAILVALGQYLPNIIAQLMTFLTNVINALSENLPILVQAVVNLFMTFFASIIEALKGMDTQTLQDALLGVGVFSAILVAFAGFSELAIPAMKGVAGLAGVIAEITALIAAAGAIAQIPGFTWLIGEGGELLQGVGKAIGKFAGGIIGGFAEGISSSFPQIATDLSNFMNNLKPFIEGTKEVDAESMAAVGSVVDMILKLTAADLISGIKRFFSFGQEGTSFSSFAEELVAFGPKVKQFSNSVKGIDETAVKAAASAASIMNEVATKLPKTGGFWQDIVGTPKTLETFGKELASFGPSIKAFSNSVSGGIDEGAITAAANAAKIMNEVATKLPKTGGFWQKFFGEGISLSTFGKELEKFGPSIKAYNDSIKGGIDNEAITSSANAAKAMTSLADTLPSSGGFLQTFFGEQNLETFGDQLKSFGGSMKAYSDAITDGNGFDAGAVTASANAGKALVSLATDLPKAKGMFSFFTGKNDISSFGSQLKKFGEAFKGYYDAIKEINTTTLSSVLTSVGKLVKLANDTKDLDTNGLKNFGKNLKKMGDNGITKFIEAFTDSEKKVKNAINTMIGYVTDKLDSSQDTIKEKAKDAGKKAGSGLKSGMESQKDALITSVKGIITELLSTITGKLTNETLKPTGSKLISGLGSGMNNEANNLSTTIKQISKSVISSFTTFLSEASFKTIGSNILTAFRNGMVEHENGKNSAYKMAYDISKSVRDTISNTLKYDNFETIGKNIGTGLANGMNSKVQTVAKAATSLANAAANSTRKTLQVKSPSKITTKIGEYFGQGLINGIGSMISAVGRSGEDLSNSAVTPLQAAISALNDFMETDPDFSPVITPILDLSNVTDGAGQISSIFNGNLKLGTSLGLANMASSGFRNFAYNNSTEEDNRIESKLNDLIKKADEDKENITYNNTFNIRSTDPKMTANEVDQILQHQVERRKAVWAK